MAFSATGRYASISIRSISTQAQAQAAVQRVFLCFNEWTTQHHIEEQRKLGNSTTERKVVRSFTIDDNGISTDDSPPVELTFVASNPTEETRKLNPWVKYGHKILHNHGCNGRRISWLDMLQLHPKFEHSSRTKTKIKTFPVDKHTLSWGEIDGKLYSIGDGGSESSDKYFTRFQVLDSENNSKWKSLHTPPYLLGRCEHHWIPQRALFLDMDGDRKFIIGWDRDLPTTFFHIVQDGYMRPGVNDLLEQDFRWNELPYDIRSHGGRPFLIHHKDHPVFDDFSLFFDYNPFADNPLQICLYCVSDYFCDSFQAINNSTIELPTFCRDYLPVRPSADIPRLAGGIDTGFPADILGLDYLENPGNSALHLMYSRHSFPVFEFVNLGDQKFGFILHKHRYFDPSYWADNKDHEGEPGGVLFLTYKYDIVVVNDTMEIRTVKTGCRHFRYRSQVPTSDGIFMMGAFLI